MDSPSADYHAHTDDACHAHIDDDTYLCCPIPPDGQDSGALLSHHLDRLRRLSQINLNLAILCLACIGVNVVCLIINSKGGEFVDEHEHTFHLLEFWSTFIFSVVQVYSLVYSPRSLGAVYSNPCVLKMVMFVNVVATFIPAVLVSVDLDAFEAWSHETEYGNELTMSFVDVVLLAVLWKQFRVSNNGAGTAYGGGRGVCFTFMAALVALLVAVVQLAIYNGMHGYDGGPGEVMAHFFEFGFEMLSSLISFSFCMDNKFLCDQMGKEVILSRQRTTCPTGVARA